MVDVSSPIIGSNRVPDDTNVSEVSKLERTNAELTASLARCRELLEDCRSKLVANGNDQPDHDQARSG